MFSVVPSTEPCALRSTQPLKVSTTDFSWGKGGRCVWLTTYHSCSAETSRKSGALIYTEPLRPPRPVAGDLTLSCRLCSQKQCALAAPHSRILSLTYILIIQYIPAHKAQSSDTNSYRLTPKRHMTTLACVSQFGYLGLSYCACAQCRSVHNC